MDGSNMDRFEEVQPIEELAHGRLEWQNKQGFDDDCM